MKRKISQPLPLPPHDVLDVLDDLQSLGISNVVISSCGIITHPSGTIIGRSFPWRNESVWRVQVYFKSGRIEATSFIGRLLEPPTIPEILARMDRDDVWETIREPECNPKTEKRKT